MTVQYVWVRNTFQTQHFSYIVSCHIPEAKHRLQTQHLSRVVWNHRSQSLEKTAKIHVTYTLVKTKSGRIQMHTSTQTTCSYFNSSFIYIFQINIILLFRMMQSNHRRKIQCMRKFSNAGNFHSYFGMKYWIKKNQYKTE